MNIAVERLPDCKAKLNIEIPSDVVEKERSGLVSAYTAQAKLPGYRPGKIPKGVIEKKFKKVDFLVKRWTGLVYSLD